jgi:hypothetical protein
MNGIESTYVYQGPSGSNWDIRVFEGEPVRLTKALHIVVVEAVHVWLRQWDVIALNPSIRGCTL